MEAEEEFETKKFKVRTQTWCVAFAAAQEKEHFGVTCVAAHTGKK